MFNNLIPRKKPIATGNYGTSTDRFNIGGGGIFDVASANGNFFDGQIDEVIAVQRALTTTEITSLYQAGINAVGVSVVPFVNTDVGPTMSNITATAYIRLPFTVSDPSSVSLLTLKMRYDDGFVAYLNGVEQVRVNAARHAGWRPFVFAGFAELPTRRYRHSYS